MKQRPAATTMHHQATEAPNILTFNLHVYTTFTQVMKLGSQLQHQWQLSYGVNAIWGKCLMVQLSEGAIVSRTCPLG